MDVELDVSETDNDQLQVVDIGDVFVETKQQFPGGQFQDCIWGFGTRSGC